MFCLFPSNYLFAKWIVKKRVSSFSIFFEIPKKTKMIIFVCCIKKSFSQVAKFAEVYSYV